MIKCVVCRISPLEINTICDSYLAPVVYQDNDRPFTKQFLAQPLRLGLLLSFRYGWVVVVIVMEVMQCLIFLRRPLIDMGGVTC